MAELTRIPVLNLTEDGADQSGWKHRKNGKDVPIMEPIIEDEELCDLLQFTSEDIKTEVDFWSTAVYGYILGANPPWEMSFVYGEWHFLVRIKTLTQKENLLNSGPYLFENKPIILRPWSKDVDLIKEKVDKVPVWVKLYGIPIKFWGDCLPSIAGLVGKFVRKDLATQDKTRLSFARVMVELTIDQVLKEKVRFLDEGGHVVDVRIEYEWKPMSFSICKGLGHGSQHCRKAKPKPVIKPGPTKVKPQKVWRPVQKTVVSTVFDHPTAIFTPEVFPPLASMVKSTPASNLCEGWSVSTNSSWHNGGRIWIFWKPECFQVQFLSYSAQHINMKVISRTDDKEFLLTMIYAFNGVDERHSLWDFFKQTATTCNEPWIWLRDFNTVLSPIERLGGNSTEQEMEQFQECTSLCCMDDIQATGALYTWSNKQAPQDRVYSRLDRAMGNLEWMAAYGNYNAHFHPEGLFDHCPCTIIDRTSDTKCRRNFKYFNMWGQSELFNPCVANVWNRRKEGTKMFQVVKKLKELKPDLKQLNKNCFSDIETSFNVTGMLLDKIQRELECIVAQELRDLQRARDSFLIQKAKLQWSLEGDINTAYFHNAMRKRVMQNKVLCIQNQHRVLYTDGAQIQAAFLDYYQGLLGSHSLVDPVNINVVHRGKCCTTDDWTQLNKPISAEEVKACLFSIPKDKSPGPDGYTSQFFKDAWDIVGCEICAAIINFFETGKLLTQINATSITLIPKMDRPTSVKHFRPIACCNVLYKTISKLLCKRLVGVLPDIISRNQGAFVHGRSILENILICQDLVRFRRLVMTCITTTSFSLNLNGSMFGYFSGTILCVEL
ncbi:uncharacterized protein LOC141608057 [Silene latifolia]|uniref:uncharacterized protein LOC141608057 n=1 Tax=Silene latifolia TaxID=37657 RepID=UPI003D7790FC